MIMICLIPYPEALRTDIQFTDFLYESVGCEMKNWFLPGRNMF